MKFCAQPHCGVLVQKGRCAKHARQVERNRPNTEMRKLYYTQRWARMKALVRSEQPLCDDCLTEGRSVPGTEIDHTIPHRERPDLFFDRENLRNKCHFHHGQKTGRGQ